MNSEIRIVDACKGPFLPRAVTGERCGICAYFHSFLDDSACGTCRRHAPVIPGNITYDEYCYPLWPTVTSADWCGDFARVIEKGGGK